MILSQENTVKKKNPGIPGLRVPTPVRLRGSGNEYYLLTFSPVYGTISSVGKPPPAREALRPYLTKVDE